MTELLQMALLNYTDKTKLLLVNGTAFEWLPIELYYVIGSHFIPAASCYGFHFVMRFFFHLTFVFLFLAPIFCLCTCWRLKRSRRCGAPLSAAGPRSSPFPLANMDLCAQDSVCSASLSSSPLLPSWSLFCSTGPTPSNVRTVKPQDLPVYKSLWMLFVPGGNFTH